MTNLLPADEMERLNREYIVRVVIVYLFLIFVVFILAVAFLVPSYFLSLAKEGAVLERVEILKRNQGSGVSQDITKSIQDTNYKISLLSSFDKKPIVFQDIILPILNDVPTGVKVEEIYYLKEKNKSRTINLKGRALNREALLSFEKNLKQSKYFSGVDLPVSNLVKSRDLNFTIRLTLVGDLL